MRKAPSIIALLSLAMFAPVAHAMPIFAFGDSTTDVGNHYLYPLSAGQPATPYVNGEYSNGPNWIQDLAIRLGNAPLTASLAGGTNYAYGGANTGVTPFNIAPADIDLLGTTGQIAQFFSTHTSADPNALYVFWIANNDIIDIARTVPNLATAKSDVNISVTNVDTAINQLAAGVQRTSCSSPSRTSRSLPKLRGRAGRARAKLCHPISMGRCRTAA